MGWRSGLAFRHSGCRCAEQLVAAITIIPFSVMAISLCAGWILGDARAGDRRMVGAIVIGAFVALVAANFAYIYPILTDQLLPYPKWLSRMWFRTWI